MRKMRGRGRVADCTGLKIRQTLWASWVQIPPPPSETLASESDVNQVRSLRPALLSRFLGDFPALLWRQSVRACSTALLSTQAPHLDRSGVSRVRFGIGRLARGDVADHLR